MPGARIDDDLGGLVRLLDFGPHLLDGVNRDPLIKRRRRDRARGALRRSGQIDRVLGVKLIRRADDPAVPGHSGLEARVMCGVEPDDPPAPAEAGVPSLLVSPLPAALTQATRRVEVRDYLSVGNLRDDLGDDLGDTLDSSRRPLPCIECGGDGQIPRLGEPSAKIFDMVVDPKDLPGRRGSPGTGRSPRLGRHGLICGNLRRRTSGS